MDGSNPQLGKGVVIVCKVENDITADAGNGVLEHERATDWKNIIVVNGRSAVVLPSQSRSQHRAPGHYPSNSEPTNEPSDTAESQSHNQ